MGAYDDIIGLDRPEPLHTCMPRAGRAKQFMPFASLKGYGAAIEARQVIYVPRPARGEEDERLLDHALGALARKLGARERPVITCECFEAKPDDPDLGRVVELTGRARRLDLTARTLVLEDRTVAFEDLYALRIEDT